MLFIVHYAEITLKGKNRPIFERQLMNNIRRSFARQDITVELWKENTRFIGEFEEMVDEELAASILSEVPGIKNFSFAYRAERSMEGILDAADQLLNRQTKNSLAVITKRSDKSFPQNSMEISSEIGRLAVQRGFTIDLDHPEITLYVEVTHSSAFLYDKKHPGLSGLPVGTAGAVLSMLSGGLDSPVASWMMMKRGCQVDFIHFHTFNDNQKVLDTKIKSIVEILNRYQYEARLILAPYCNYEVLSMGKVKGCYDLVVFRNFMFRMAQRVAERYGYKALVTGDNVGQVASQTLDNLSAATYQVDIPIMRPLVAFDKDQIVQLAQKIGTFDIGNLPYKDCCSIIAPGSHTAANLERLQENLEKLDMESIVERSLDETEIFDITSHK